MDREDQKDTNTNNDDTTNQECSSAIGKQHRNPREKEENGDLIQRRQETNILCTTSTTNAGSCAVDKTQSTSLRTNASSFQDDNLITTSANNNDNSTDVTVNEQAKDDLAFINSSSLLLPARSRIQFEATTGRMMGMGRINPDSALINQSNLPRESEEDFRRTIILQQPRNITDSNECSSITIPPNNQLLARPSPAGTSTNDFLHQQHLNKLSSEADRCLLLEALMCRQNSSRHSTIPYSNSTIQQGLIHHSSTSHTQQHLFDWTAGIRTQQRLLNSASMTTAGLSNHLLNSTEHQRAYHSTAVHPPDNRTFRNSIATVGGPSTLLNASDVSHQFQPNSSRNTVTNPNSSSWIYPIQDMQGTNNNSNKKEKDSKRNLANTVSSNAQTGEEERPCKKRKARRGDSNKDMISPDEPGYSSLEEIHSTNQGANAIHPLLSRNGIRATLPTEVTAFNSPFLPNAWTSGSLLLQNTPNTLPIQSYRIYGQSNTAGRQEENNSSQTYSFNRGPNLSAMEKELQDPLLVSSVDGSIVQNNIVNVPTAVTTEEAKQGLEQGQPRNSSSASTFEMDQIDQEEKKKILEEKALQMRVAEGSGKHFLPLGIENLDSTRLSKFLCFIRLECIELFTATSEVVLERMSSKKVTADQVGIRCVFCANLPARKRAGRSSNFPSSISRLYQGVSMMIYSHFGRCNEMPVGIRAKFEKLRKSTKKGDTESRSYWIESAKLKGLVDCGEEQGIRIKRRI